jgi:hypothetical protein
LRVHQGRGHADRVNFGFDCLMYCAPGGLRGGGDFRLFGSAHGFLSTSQEQCIIRQRPLCLMPDAYSSFAVDLDQRYRLLMY